VNNFYEKAISKPENIYVAIAYGKMPVRLSICA